MFVPRWQKCEPHEAICCPYVIVSTAYSIERYSRLNTIMVWIWNNHISWVTCDIDHSICSIREWKFLTIKLYSCIMNFQKNFRPFRSKFILLWHVAQNFEVPSKGCRAIFPLWNLATFYINPRSVEAKRLISNDPVKPAWIIDRSQVLPLFG